MGTDSSIDWCCLPHFDSPGVFNAILDDGRGGRFRIHSVGDANVVKGGDRGRGPPDVAMGSAAAGERVLGLGQGPPPPPVSRYEY